MVNGIGNLGNLMGSYVWKAEWGPAYHQSMAISFGALGIATALSVCKCLFLSLALIGVVLASLRAICIFDFQVVLIPIDSSSDW
jgi:hypothetical protein